MNWLRPHSQKQMFRFPSPHGQHCWEKKNVCYLSRLFPGSEMPCIHRSWTNTDILISPQNDVFEHPCFRARAARAKWLSHEDIIKSRLLFMYYYFTDLPIFVFSAFLFLTERPTAYFHERWLTFMGDGNEEFYRDGLSVNTCENVIDTRVLLFPLYNVISPQYLKLSRRVSRSCTFEIANVALNNL